MASSGAPVVQPDGRLLKLWAHTIGKLDLAASRRQAVARAGLCREASDQIQRAVAFADFAQLRRQEPGRETRP